MKRNKTIDIAKGMCIICMIIVHFFSWWGKYPEFNKYVGVFFLVFFFIASGFFFKTPIDYKKYIYKRIKKLLVPYIIFTLIYLLYISFQRGSLFGPDYINTLKTIFASLITALPAEFNRVLWFDQSTIGIGPIWFLNCLFFTNMIYILINKTKHKFLLSLVVAIIGQLTQKIILIPFNIQVALIGCLFFAIGDCGKNKISQYVEFLKKKTLKINFLLLIVELSIYYFTINYLPHQWMNLGQNSYEIISIISTLVGVTILLSVSIIVEKTEFIEEFFNNYGKDSMFILILHNLDILILRNWNYCTWEFLVATILGYYFINYIKNRIELKIESVKLRKNNLLSDNDSNKQENVYI